MRVCVCGADIKHTTDGETLRSLSFRHQTTEAFSIPSLFIREGGHKDFVRHACVQHTDFAPPITHSHTFSLIVFFFIHDCRTGSVEQSHSFHAHLLTFCFGYGLLGPSLRLCALRHTNKKLVFFLFICGIIRVEHEPAAASPSLEI